MAIEDIPRAAAAVRDESPASRRGRRARGFVLALTLAAALCGCGADRESSDSARPQHAEPDAEGRRSVVLDLTRVTHGLVNEAVTPIASAGSGAERHLIQTGPGALDLFVRLPADAEIVFSVDDSVKPGDFGVEATSDEKSKALALEGGAGNEWRAALADFGEVPVRLRFEVHTPGEFRWLRPRVTGRSRMLPPAIDPALRPPFGRVNVLFYLIDTARFDRFSVDGYDHPTSPNLARLASQGLLLTGGNAPASSTIPSVSALFASRHPSELGGRLDRERRERKTLAEAFDDAGYATAAFQANYLLKRPMGYARGFDTYEIVTSVRPAGKRTAWADELHEPAIAWLRANADQPFFLYLQSMDVHDYHTLPAFNERFRRADSPAADSEMTPEDIDMENFDPEMRPFLDSLSDRYDASIAYADHEIGNLLAVLEELGIAEKTVVVVTSDHGEPLGQRGALLHGGSLFQELVHVPVVIHMPWLSEGRRIEENFSLIDLGPTLADLVGVPVPAWWSGRSLLRPRWEISPSSPVGAIGVVHWGRRRKPRAGGRGPMAPSWFVREGDWKLIQDRDGIHLFHIPSDPGEEHDRQAEHPILARYLAIEIARRSPSFRAGWQKPQALEETLAEPDREELQKALRSLGYVE